ncbi:MAG: metalloregulator ArsR/SmtB family transcription factor [Bacillota bacterium]|nr:metalloregulator ArsR/SmtB family transcription factor [Bacillota bacterium]
MLDYKNINFKVHMPMEFLYSLFASGTEKLFYEMIREFELEPNKKIVTYIAEMKKGLSRFMHQELDYFFDLSGLGYIFYKIILNHPELDNIEQLLNILKNLNPNELVLYVIESVCKNNIPNEDREDYKLLKYDTDRMLALINMTSFQDPQRKLRVIEALQNPEEIQQRFHFLLSQFYIKSFKPIEREILDILTEEKNNYVDLFKANQKLFLEQYLSLDSFDCNTNLIIHLSFFKYVSWHSYSLFKPELPDWFILGIYSNLLFEKNLSAEKLSYFFKSLSDPNRIEIIKLLAERPWFGQELAEKLNITPATISYHMGFLQQIGAVTFKRADNRSYYSLNITKLLKPMTEFVEFFKN